MKIKTGNIPEKLTFFVRPPEKVYFRWDDVDYDDTEKGTEFTVNPCFISDADNKKTLKTGKHWAESYRYWDQTERKYKENKKYTSFTVENKPFNDLQIITLEIRDKGGRAYKVNAKINGRTVYFDLREDVLLDIMFNSGIKPGAIIKGEFIFARIGSQMKVIRVGSLLHETMIESTKLETKSKLNLEVGGVYCSKNGDEYVFLGEYFTRDIKLEGYEKGKYDYNLREYSYYFKSAKLKNPEKVFVFHRYYDFYDEDGSLWFHNKDTQYSKRGEINALGLHIIKSHNFKIKTKQITVPENYYLDVKNNILKDHKENYIVGEQCKLVNLSKEKGYIHPIFEKYK